MAKKKKPRYWVAHRKITVYEVVTVKATTRGVASRLAGNASRDGQTDLKVVRATIGSPADWDVEEVDHAVLDANAVLEREIRVAQAADAKRAKLNAQRQAAAAKRAKTQPKPDFAAEASDDGQDGPAVADDDYDEG